MSMPAAWWNGEPALTLPVTARGLHYGDGVFRTLAVSAGRVLDLDLQLEKLASDAAAIDLATPAGLRESLLASASGEGDAVLKLMLMRSGTGRGYRPTTTGADSLLLRYEVPVFDPACWTQGIRAIRSPVTMAAQPRLAGIKPLNRLEQVLASRSWPEGVDEAILGDERGAPVCGTRSNLFWITRGIVHTPAVDRCGVAGLMRAKLLALCDARGLETHVAVHPWSALIAANEAFVCNSLIGIWPLRALDAQEWSAPGPVTADLMQALAHPTLRAT